MGLIDKLEQFTSRQRASGLNPYEQVMIEEHLKNHPEDDFTGIPGYEIVQQRFKEKMNKQNPFNASQGGDTQKKESGKTSKSQIGQNEDTSFVPDSGPQFGAKGFEYPNRSHKNKIFDRIQQKKIAGIQLSKGEILFEKQYLKISDSVTVPSTAEDRLRIRNLAKSMSKVKMVDEFGVEEDYEPTEEQINDHMIEAVKFLYPKLDINADESFSTYLKTDKKEINLDIELPSNITKTSQALKFLTDNGFQEEEAKNWLKSKRMEAKGQKK